MDFVLGLIVGIFLTVLVAAAGIWYFLRRSSPLALVPPASASVGQPSMVTTMSQVLINRVLAESFDPQAEPVPVVGPVKFKLDSMWIQVHTQHRAEITANITVSGGPLKFSLHPIIEILLEHNAGRVRIYVVNLQLAGVTIPHAWVDRFVRNIVSGSEAKMNFVLEQIHTQMGVALFGLDTNEQEVILKFK